MIYILELQNFKIFTKTHDIFIFIETDPTLNFSSFCPLS